MHWVLLMGDPARGSLLAPSRLSFEQLILYPEEICIKNWREGPKIIYAVTEGSCIFFFNLPVRIFGNLKGAEKSCMKFRRFFFPQRLFPFPIIVAIVSHFVRFWLFYILFSHVSATVSYLGNCSHVSEPCMQSWCPVPLSISLWLELLQTARGQSDFTALKSVPITSTVCPTKTACSPMPPTQLNRWGNGRMTVMMMDRGEGRHAEGGEDQKLKRTVKFHSGTCLFSPLRGTKQDGKIILEE